jgi:hypothetical protein
MPSLVLRRRGLLRDAGGVLWLPFVRQQVEDIGRWRPAGWYVDHRRGGAMPSGGDLMRTVERVKLRITTPCTNGFYLVVTKLLSISGRDEWDWRDETRSR